MHVLVTTRLGNTVRLARVQANLDFAKLKQIAKRFFIG